MSTTSSAPSAGCNALAIQAGVYSADMGGRSMS